MVVELKDYLKKSSISQNCVRGLLGESLNRRNIRKRYHFHDQNKKSKTSSLSLRVKSSTHWMYSFRTTSVFYLLSRKWHFEVGELICRSRCSEELKFGTRPVRLKCLFSFDLRGKSFLCFESPSWFTIFTLNILSYTHTFLFVYLPTPLLSVRGEI